MHSSAKSPILLALSLVLGPLVQAAPAQAPTMSQLLAGSSAADWRPLDPENTLYLELASGRVVIELAPAFAPLHVANIRALAHAGYFNGLAILRVQDDYVVQWGDADGTRALADGVEKVAAEFDAPIGAHDAFTRLPDGDVYAPLVGFSGDFPAARDPKIGRTWLVHCYAMVGVGRDDDTRSTGAELYAVIGHAPRHLDRNVALVGRIVKGIDELSSLPRGGEQMGFYSKTQATVPIRAIELAADVAPAERSNLEVLRTDSRLFLRVIESRRNRPEEWFKAKAGHIDVCNVPIPVREIPPAAAQSSP
ncbi:MAG: peptidylprolyl isomerase [Steroidobacteraceae bacterium]